jgi:hypothetical protein
MCRQFGCGPTVCPQRVMACVDNRCAVLDPPILVASDYDQRCRVDSDCTLIVTGPMCADCNCARGAVSQAGYAAWQRRLDEQLCITRVADCECGASFAVCVPSPDGDGGHCDIRRVP